MLLPLMLSEASTSRACRSLSGMSRFPTGIERIASGECQAAGPHACTFCQYGHMTECHFPHTCGEAQCDHFLDEQDVDVEGYEEAYFDEQNSDG